MTMKHTAWAIFTALLIIGLAGAAHAAPRGTKDGVWGIPVGGMVQAPMRIWYEDSANPGDPGFIHFENVQGGSSPCKNSGAGDVEVMRISDTKWTVSASDQIYGCATLPGRKKLAGFFIMPFSFTVEVILQRPPAPGVCHA